MRDSKVIYLSYTLNRNTPTYGDRNRFKIEKKSSIKRGDIANDSFISTTVHIGTHIDMPYHFFESGETIEDFPANFWKFSSGEVLFIELEEIKNLVIEDELIKELEKIEDKLNYKLLLVKTGICIYEIKESFGKETLDFLQELQSI